jgi:hypothetical protein
MTKIELDALVKEIARELGDRWTDVVEDGERRKLRDPSGMMLYVSAGWQNGKITIGLSTTGYHDNLPYRLAVPSININPARGATAIAKEIVRRLLPDAAIYYEAMVAAKARDEAYKAKKAAALTELAGVFGFAANDRQLADGRVHEFLGRVTVIIQTGSTTADLEFRSLSVETAKAICQKLMEEVQDD